MDQVAPFYTTSKVFQILSKMEAITDDKNSHFFNDKDLEVLVVASIQTLKRGNKKCGKEEVCKLVTDSLNMDIAREALTLNLNIFGKQECLSLPKTSCKVSDDTVKKILIS